LNDHINDTLALMDELGIEKANLLGESGGSYIAQGVASTKPGRIHKLILVVSKAHGIKSSSQLFYESHAAEMSGMNEHEQRLYLIDHVFAQGFLDKVGPEFLLPQPLALSPQEAEAANKAFEGFDFRPVLHRISAPTLVINGKYDGLNPPPMGLEIASYIPNSTFVEMQHSGHAPSLEEPEKFSELVMDFLHDRA
jgi:3-oxoadipate enol-lactonase